MDSSNGSSLFQYVSNVDYLKGDNDKEQAYNRRNNIAKCFYGLNRNKLKA